ncbi:hydroxyisourate hydrolase [Verrucosispora sp. WMMA2044]|uniref:hydroxyisourate hydrolase n=1 Tax=Verrucosispora sp. WMMA2044 TaxID=3016419 RepID=UPI00248CF4C4|nr:hydroxyisourate hydrolase [Verrucosispora sp. WMMA2044]WBB50400.1 hydroxyisourate hydrolase [Verrucosispora sp. WMMA2044]
MHGDSTPFDDRGNQALAQSRAEQEQKSMKVTAQALDVVYGRPAAGVPARLERRTPEGWKPVAGVGTDDHGHILDWSGNRLVKGDYRDVFDSGSYFADLGVGTVYPEIAVVVGLLDDMDVCDIQVLPAPYSCSMFIGARS